MYAQYPDAEIEAVNDHLPEEFGVNAAFAEIVFKHSSTHFVQVWVKGAI